MDIKQIAEMAKENLRRDKGLIATAIVNSPKGKVVIGLDFRDDEEKEIAIDKLRELLQKIQTDHYFIISESYYVQRKKEDGIRIRPSQQPDKKEAIVITKFTKTLEDEMMLIPFRREGDNIIFEKEEYMKSSEILSKFNIFKEMILK